MNAVLENPQVLFPVIVICGYLLGSIPFGLVLCRLCGYGDIRKIGSGNIGATNVLRTGNKPLALATLVLDIGKGAAAVFAVRAVVGFDDSGLLPGGVAGTAAVIGHNFPVWLKFQGGKGVATTLGTMLAAFWPAGATAIAVWLVVAGVFRYSSLAGMLSLFAPPIVFWYHDLPVCAAIAAFLTVLICLRHHQNIQRLLNGTETKIGRKS
ncbi:MAG: glycerol-3-phosphate 1-O-acyltransferase PlsY [Alphaproteobacteria bacterium]